MFDVCQIVAEALVDDNPKTKFKTSVFNSRDDYMRIFTFTNKR